MQFYGEQMLLLQK